ncbi:MAG: HAD-IA family hydrolase [Clostridia bacterium]|nr:HAD-IA family hydrolase [Clostridia bacterium]
MYKAAIFDLDGTLAYTLEDLKTGMNEMLAICSYPLCSTERILENINGGAYEFVRRSLPVHLQDDKEEVDRCFAIYVECYSKHFKDQTCLYDGVADCIAALSAAGMKMAVFSNKQHMHTTALIEKLFPDNPFALVIGQGQFPHKPDPTGALHIAAQFGVTPEEMIFVGDSNVDMTTARNAGMHPVGVTWGYRDRTVLAESGAEIICDTAEALLRAAMQE